MANGCCLKDTSGNIFKNTIDNYWVKCIKTRASKLVKEVYKLFEKNELEEYFRKPYLGDHWSGKVVPEKERLL